MIGERVYGIFQDRFEEINEKMSELFRDVAHVVLLEHGWEYVKSDEFIGVLVYRKGGVKINVWPQSFEIEVMVKNEFDLFTKEDSELPLLGIYPEEVFSDYTIVEVKFDSALPEYIDDFVSFVERRMEKVMEDEA